MTVDDLGLKLDRVLAELADQRKATASLDVALSMGVQALNGGPDSLIGILLTLREGIAELLKAAGTEGGSEMHDAIKRIEALLAQQTQAMQAILHVLGQMVEERP